MDNGTDTIRHWFSLPVITRAILKIQKIVGGRRLASLEATERSYHELIDGLNVASRAIVITRPDGQISFANQRMFNLVEHTKSKQLAEALHPEDQEKYLDFRNDMVASGIENTIEVRYRDEKNGIRWLKVNARPIRFEKVEKGSHQPFLEIIEDITDQKNTDETIRVSEEKYRTVIDTILDEYWETDMEGQFVFWNSAFAESVGLSPEEIKLLKPRDWIENYSKSVSYNGNPANLVTVIDITDQKQAQEELQKSQFRLVNHVESTPMGVIEFDNEFIITAWNPAAEKIFGYSKAEAIGRNTFDILVPDYERQRVKEVHLLTDPKSNENINDNLTKDWEDYYSPMV
ncbi:MAG: PAS domain S-box protein [Deltaproteobacteria bacterium]|nr:PAS domain S-box protein [Deltaproteobacteria bacterium]MBT4267480.1 PAS domain S-box protein [Deltaproteobacteria bacterium]MBT4644170.1 PAS domain S-box protein [Deltaproteobacteria bacterium]MBT6504013.1 PAS domain S-box protein [Deltaproteobacteria bacterium]MBT6613472.1 PAS domain S-box protein [Deltaproteobacteria bacterium]